MAKPKSPYGLGRSAKDVYDDLARSRTGVIDKARELAEITIPSLFPPEGYQSGDRLAPPNQSINSRCVNTMASKLMFTSAPPGKPCLKFNIVEHKLQDEIDEDPQLFVALEAALQRREESHRKRMENTFMRSSLTLAYKYLLGGGGNVLWEHLDINRPVAHRMDTYVVKRNKKGDAHIIILHEPTLFMDLEGPDKQFVRLIQHGKGIEPDVANPYDEKVDIYTCQRWDEEDDAWYYWQEFEGQMLPDTEAKFTRDDPPPLFAAWLVPRFGHNWGGSYAEEYEGDMFIVENSSGALNDISEAAALLWLFLKPGAATSKKALEQAENFKVMTGEAGDVTAFRLEKGADAALVDGNLQKAAQRLAAAWLMMTSIQRDAERVTAEEWRMLAGELDQAMGGLYSELAQGFGRHVIRRFLSLHEEEDEDIPPLPEGVVSVAVVTGIDALTRSTELEALARAGGHLKEVFGESIAQTIDPMNYARRVFTAEGIKADGLLVSPDKIAAEQAAAKQEQMGQTVLDKATGPIAKAGAETLSQVMLSQMEGAQTPTA